MMRTSPRPFVAAALPPLKADREFADIAQLISTAVDTVVSFAMAVAAVTALVSRSRSPSTSGGLFEVGQESVGSTIAWELVCAPGLVNRFGQAHPHPRKPYYLGAFLGIIHTFRER